MKKLITSVVLLLTAFNLLAQTNPLLYNAEAMPNTIPGTLTMPYTAIKIDTVACWFKEFTIVNDKPFENWIKGYTISNNRSVFVEYLYADRKTRVTNPVIYSITK